jgi:putative transposase
MHKMGNEIVTVMDIIELIQQGKISRYFRSRKKLCHAGLVSHITQRAAGKDVLFIDDEDYRSMLGLMKKLSLKFTIEILAFCFMPNHIHLLIRPEQDNLHLFFRDLCGQYARRFNRRHERKGHLFGGAFRQAVVLDDSYLLAASLYIHLNPVRAGIAERPGDYHFSSCRLYTMDKPPTSFVKPSLVLSLLSSDEENCRKEYNKLLDNAAGVESGNVLEDEQAIERSITLLKTVFRQTFSASDKVKNKISPLPPFDLLEDSIVEFKNIRKLKSAENMKAKRYVIEQLLARGYTNAQIADRLGINRKTVYNLISLPISCIAQNG